MQFRARRSRSARVYPRATKRPQSLLLLLLSREIRRRNCERGSRLLLIAAKINPDRLFPHALHVSLSVPDTSVRVQRGIVSQYERGAAQESGAGGDLVDGAGKQGRDFRYRLKREIFGNEKIARGNVCESCEFFFFLLSNRYYEEG